LLANAGVVASQPLVGLAANIAGGRLLPIRLRCQGCMNSIDPVWVREH
jgi:hypothetical protein